MKQLGQYRMWLSLIALYAFWRVWLLGIAYGAMKFIPFVSSYTPRDTYGLNLPWWQWVWANFDGVVFLKIAKDSYSQSEVPFFPLFPWIVRFWQNCTQLPYLQSGLVVSVIAFFIAIFFVWKLLQREGKIALWPLTAILLLSFPTAYHYTAVYNDSLFFALATGALYFTRERKYFWAGTLGGLATLARLNGLGLFFVLIVEYILSFIPAKEAWNWRSWKQAFVQSLQLKALFSSGIFFALLIPISFVGYLAFIEYRFGDWHLFFSGVEVWHRNKLTFPLQTFWRYVKILLISPNFTFVYLIAFLEALFTLLYLTVLAFSWKKIPPAYWIMMFFHWLIPALTGTLQGMPRYGLHLFPLFFTLALFFEKRPRWQQGAFVILCLALQIFYVAFFTRGYFVS